MNLELHQGDLDYLGQMWTWAGGTAAAGAVIGSWFTPIECHGNADRIETHGNQDRIATHGNQEREWKAL